jgi:hypothetical protein
MSFFASLFGLNKALAKQTSPGLHSNQWANTEALQNQRSIDKQQYQRINAAVVRIVIGNEITDYYFPQQENEVLWETDFNSMIPIHKYFGRFKEGLFTGIKYNYGYAPNRTAAGKYVESIFEYEQGYPKGLQIYFSPDGDVIRKGYNYIIPSEALLLPI